MKIFRLEPSAAPDDPNWDIAPSQGIVIVRAASPADARLVASEAESDFLNSGSLPADDKSTRFASAFRNDKLYSVSEVNDERFESDGPREIVEGRINPNVIRKS